MSRERLNLRGKAWTYMLFPYWAYCKSFVNIHSLSSCDTNETFTNCFKGLILFLFKRFGWQSSFRLPRWRPGFPALFNEPVNQSLFGVVRSQKDRNAEDNATVREHADKCQNYGGGEIGVLHLVLTNVVIAAKANCFAKNSSIYTEHTTKQSSKQQTAK